MGLTATQEVKATGGDDGLDTGGEERKACMKDDVQVPGSDK